jgi:hypothetical protein
MARIRTIKPEFWTDEKVVSLSPLARLLFIGMWNFVDDYGRSEFSPIRLKMQILPADAVEIGGLLGEIVEAGLITIYSVGDKRFFEVRGFTKHQKVDHRSASKIPPPQPPPPNSPEPSRKTPLEGIKEGIKEEENNNTALKGKNGVYAFRHGCVKLTEENLAQWRESFSHVSVTSTLIAAEPWLAKQKSWFNAAAGLLDKREREATKPPEPKPAGPRRGSMLGNRN